MLNKVLLAAVLFSLTLFSCQEGGPLDGRGGDPGNGEEFLMMSIGDIEEINIETGDETNEFDIEYPVESQMENGKCEAPHFKGKKGKKHRKGDGLKLLFKSLDLDDSQKEDMKSFMEAYRDCAKPSFTELRDLHKEYKADANLQRKEVIEQIKAGNISKDEAKAEFRAIHDATKEAMLNNEERVEIIDAIKQCRENLHESISSILTAEQLEKFNTWLAEKQS